MKQKNGAVRFSRSNVLTCVFAFLYSAAASRKDPLETPLLNAVLTMAFLVHVNLLTILCLAFGRELLNGRFGISNLTIIEMLIPIGCISALLAGYYAPSRRRKRILRAYEEASPERRGQIRVVALSYIAGTLALFVVVGVVVMLPR